MLPRRSGPTRRGVAAVELAVVFLFFMVPMMLGVWEIGRLVHVQQIVSNSAREGARMASQGYTIGSNGGVTQIYASNASGGYTAGSPTVKDTVYNYLIAAGLSGLAPGDVTTTFTFTSATAAGAIPPDPYLGEKNQTFTVKVSVPWNKVRWVNLGFLPQNSQVEFTVTWRMLVDDAFSVNATLPTW